VYATPTGSPSEPGPACLSQKGHNSPGAYPDMTYNVFSGTLNLTQLQITQPGAYGALARRTWLDVYQCQ